MSYEVIARDVIKAQARRAAEADYEAGRTVPDCPYEKGTAYAKKWLAAYWQRECELHDRQAEQLEVA